ncbi:MAG: aminotransferase class V-fold PLP-dependent enzyme [Brevinemataceae bacterium]
MNNHSAIINNIRKHFPFFQSVNGQSLVYFDSAATTFTPQSVLDVMNEYYTQYPANIHRAVYNISHKASDCYEKARETTAEFLGARTEEIAFTSGTTAGINLFAESFAESFLQEGDRIILSTMEHHSNLLPWQKIAKKYKCTLDFILTTENGELDLSNLHELLSAPTKLLALTAVSNTLGTINPINQIADACKQHNVYFMVDAAQSIMHHQYKLSESNIDFLVFSGHKMFGPKGIGVFWGRKSLLKQMSPFFLGGGMVYDVDLYTASFADIPSKFEAGTPPIAEALGLAATFKFIQEIGWNTIHDIDHMHTDIGRQIFDSFSDYIHVFGNSDSKIPIFSFQINETHPHDAGSFFNELNIAVRTGHQCTQPVWKQFFVPSTVRVSAGIYNTLEEWEQFSKAVQSLLEFFHVRKFS